MDTDSKTRCTLAAPEVEVVTAQIGRTFEARINGGILDGERYRHVDADELTRRAVELARIAAGVRA